MSAQWLALLELFIFLNDPNPDRCLVADQLSGCTKILESTGADSKKDFLLNWI
jgi:hypothetical protein